MESSKQHPLEKEVHVDEFEIGTPQAGEQGRSKSDKKVRVVVAFEDRDGKAGRGLRPGDRRLQCGLPQTDFRRPYQQGCNHQG